MRLESSLRSESFASGIRRPPMAITGSHDDVVNVEILGREVVKHAGAVPHQLHATSTARIAVNCSISCAMHFAPVDGPTIAAGAAEPFSRSGAMPNDSRDGMARSGTILGRAASCRPHLHPHTLESPCPPRARSDLNSSPLNADAWRP